MKIGNKNKKKGQKKKKTFANDESEHQVLRLDLFNNVKNLSSACNRPNLSSVCSIFFKLYNEMIL